MISKKIAIIIGVLVFGISAYGSYSYFSGGSSTQLFPTISNYSPPKSNGNGNQEVVSTEPKTEQCPINGEMLTKTQKSKWEKRRPLGLMVENHTDARPQSGLSSADVVYEAVAEGGITRFLAVYYCKDAAYVGPVRSARVHFMTMLQEYGDYPLYGHVGGANCDRETGSGCANGAPADALGIIRKLGWEGYNDLNQFGVPFPYFWRDYERLPNRVTEHTVYTSTSKLYEYAKTKRKLTNVDEDGKKWDANFTSWKFADDAKSDKRGSVKKISFGFWNSFAKDFAVVWSYIKETNSYVQNNGGIPHTDKNTGKPLEAKNVIIVFAEERPANDGYSGGHILYGLIGSGDALVFQNGAAIKSTWEKKNEESRMKFYDDNNNEISIVRGQVFIEILPTGNKVEY